MSLADDIRTALRPVVSTGMLADPWEYRERTSASGVEPVTFGSWATIYGLFTGESIQDQYDGDRGQQVQVIIGQFRTADNATRLKPGDQVRDAALVTWTVAAVGSSGPGSIRYQLERRKALRSDAARGGGV